MHLRKNLKSSSRVESNLLYQKRFILTLRPQTIYSGFNLIGRMPLPSSPHIYRHAPVVFFGCFSGQPNLTCRSLQRQIERALCFLRQRANRALLEVAEFEGADRNSHQT